MLKSCITASLAASLLAAAAPAPAQTPATSAAATPAAATPAPAAVRTGSPEDDMPPGMERLTWFGERASWSPDGKRIAFISASFGDAFEIDLATRRITLLTGYPNPGFLRVQYMPNGDYLLIGARDFQDVDKTRYFDQEFWLLRGDRKGRPVPLDQKVSEGVAISRDAMKIAWTNDFRTSPQTLKEGQCAIYTADLVYEGGKPKLTNKKEAVRVEKPGCRMEPQDFRNNDGELIYVVYRDTATVRLSDIYGVDLKTGKKTTYRELETEYNEAEGIYPDGKYILVESDRGQAKPRGSKTLDIWKLKLEPNSTDFTRVTRFGDWPSYKATNPVVSSDGKTIAFQQGRSLDEPGLGYGLFLYKPE